MCWANPSAAIQSDHQKELIAYNRGGQVLLFDLIIKEYQYNVTNVLVVTNNVYNNDNNNKLLIINDLGFVPF